MERLPRVGCCACVQLGVYRAAEVHHLNLGGRAGQKRRGHRYTIPLCPWHHRGIFEEFGTKAEAERLLGPSMAHASREFRQRFGNDDFLLTLTDEALRLHGAAH